jgi:succinate dehydrogenase flavin-adding protein (antitoxin of CptAB toxin-antitoxin module)
MNSGISRSGIPSVTVMCFIFLFLALFLPPVSALQIDQDNIANITEQLTQFNRISGVKENKAASCIKMKMEDYGLETHFQNFSFITTGENTDGTVWVNTSNVVGIRKGNSDQIIIIGAHYDTVSPENPGADDNAGGVAVMLELARAFQGQSFNRTIYFISYSGEEFGLLGSKYWLKENDVLKDDIVAVINLDCVAMGDKLLLYSPDQWLLDIFPQKANLAKVEGDSFPGSDEWRFWEENLPAVRLNDFGNHTIWDTPQDTTDRLNYSLAGESAGIIGMGVYNLSTTKDLSPPVLNIEVNNGTIFYNVSENAFVDVILDGTNFGHMVSGQVTLPYGKHEIEIIATDAWGNKISEKLTADIEQDFYTIPRFEGVSAITIPYKKMSEDKTRKYNVLFNRLDYDIVNGTGNVTVNGYIDGIQIEDIEKNHFMIFSSGHHTFMVAAFNEKEIIGFDEDKFIHQSYTEHKKYPFSQDKSGFLSSILNILDDFMDWIMPAS